MATLKATIKPTGKRLDGTWPVYIRITQKGRIKYLPTGIYVAKDQLTRDGKLKDQRVIDKCDDIIRRYREKLLDLDVDLTAPTVDEIAEYLTAPTEGVRFSAWWQVWRDDHKTLKGIRNYATAVNTFQAFCRRDVEIAEITPQRMRDFERHLAERPRAMTQYTSAVVKIVRDARAYYNTPYKTVIPDYLADYKPPKQSPSRPRALTTEQVRAIFSCPYDGKRHHGKSSRHDLALDVFRLSFGLLGMNAPDLFSAPPYTGDVIVYERQKTRARRFDHARMEVVIQDRMKELCRKYRGKKRAFNFSERFSSYQDLTRAVNIGLSEVGRELGIARLTLYAARHSMATIAVNEVGIDKWTVNDMLNHTDQSLRVTEIYIKKGFFARESSQQTAA